MLCPLPTLNKSPFVFFCAKVINHFTIQGLPTEILLDDSGRRDLHPHPQHQHLSPTCRKPALDSRTVGSSFHTTVTSYVFISPFPLQSLGLGCAGYSGDFNEQARKWKVKLSRWWSPFAEQRGSCLGLLFSFLPFPLVSINALLRFCPWSPWSSALALPGP